MNALRYSMKNWEPVTLLEKKVRIEDQMNDLDSKRTPLVNRKRELDTELSELNAKVRSGGYLDHIEYQRIVCRQGQIKKEKGGIEEQIADIKIEQRKLNTEKEKIHAQMKLIPSDNAKTAIIELRTKYTAFAADRSRVSSMRAMAAEFAGELENVAKLFN